MTVLRFDHLPHPRQHERYPLTVWLISKLGPTRRTPRALHRRWSCGELDQLALVLGNDVAVKHSEPRVTRLRLALLSTRGHFLSAASRAM